MKEMQEFEQVERIMLGCCAYEGTWTPQLAEKDGWGPNAQAYDQSYVSTSDYDALLAYTKELAKALAVMTEDRDLWQGEHNEDCPNLAAARASEGGWIDCKQELPPKSFGHNYLVWVACDNKAGGYRDMAAFGDYVCNDEECHPGDELYIADNDDGNRKGSGWHREEETHGGEYDYIFIDLNTKVTHWQPLPSPPLSVETPK